MWSCVLNYIYRRKNWRQLGNTYECYLRFADFLDPPPVFLGRCYCRSPYIFLPWGVLTYFFCGSGWLLCTVKYQFWQALGWEQWKKRKWIVFICFLFMITQMKFGCILSVGSYFTPFRIFHPSMTHLKTPKSSSTFMIFQNKFSFPLPCLSSGRPCVLVGGKKPFSGADSLTVFIKSTRSLWHQASTWIWLDYSTVSQKAKKICRKSSVTKRKAFWEKYGALREASSSYN